ncbi:retropepsin-like aspartic protease [Chryseobacterium sp. M5A1_1a]
MRNPFFILSILLFILTICVGFLINYFSTQSQREKNKIANNEHFINIGLLTEKSTNAKKEKPTLFPNEFTTSFTSKKGLILVNADLNGSKRKFLLDSGLGSDLILNSEVRHIGRLKDSENHLNGIGGESENLQTTWINSFSWMGINFKKTQVGALPLSNIINNENDDFAGIIGFSAFSNYQLTLDYRCNILKATKEKDLAKEAKENGELLTTILFKFEQHMPVFDVDINGFKYKMALDTGATINLINMKHFKNLETTIVDLKESNVNGISGKTTSKKGFIKHTKINNINYDNMMYCFDSSSLKNLNTKYGLGIDGILGYEFLKQNITVVDFISKEIRVYDGNFKQESRENIDKIKHTA